MPNYNGTEGDDIYTGTPDSDIIVGNSGNDTLNGGDGDDLLDGGTGDDVLDGGDGEDTASYASASDWVGVHLTSSVPQDTANAGRDTLVGIENLIGSAYSDILSGNDGANRLEGGAGFDVLIGGLGNDILDGGEGEDEAHYLSAPSAVNVNLALTGAQNTGGGGVDTLVSIERVRGSIYGDVLRGDAGGNGLVGEAGDDWLFGGAGNDALNGAAGYDRMYGGTGDDIYYVSDNTDFVYELAGEGQDLVLAWVDHQLRDYVEDLILMMNGTAVIGKGNALDNWITGNDGANKLYGFDGNDGLGGNAGDDWLFGGNGNDFLSGLAGYDRMYGGDGNDIYAVTDTTDYAYENAGEGTDRVITTINYTLRANIENLQLDGSSDLRGYGNAENNIIDGNPGNNLLYGRDGDDDLRGYSGNDILYGENGNDTLQGGWGQDRLYGGAGADVFLFRDNDFAGMTSGTTDRIHDFSQVDGDRIFLNEVDANTFVGGTQPFAFIGSGAFTGTAGELRTQQISGNTYIQGDTDGDGVADFWIRLDGLHALASSDFVL
jgi:serralysin